MFTYVPADPLHPGRRRQWCSTLCRSRAAHARQMAGDGTTAASRMKAWRERKRAEGYVFVKGRPVYRGPVDQGAESVRPAQTEIDP